jgi:nicotinate-nucleotide pyrophosphorylase (carboxylating)
LDAQFKRICLEAVQRALDEDLQSAGDITSRALIPHGSRGKAKIILREEGVVAGLPLASMVFRQLDAKIIFQALVSDGDHLPAASEIAVLEGPVIGILEGERTALNFLQRLSGIATLTARFVALAHPHGVEILDTRKTTPGMRALEKYAVRAGGGRNHRFGLYDAVLIKDNHRAIAGGAAEAVAAARREGHGGAMPVQIEVDAIADLPRVLDLGVEAVLLDNMTPRQVADAVQLARAHPRGRDCWIEASGGITLESIRAYAEAGVDTISVGALTHSAPAVDIALDIASGAAGLP